MDIFDGLNKEQHQAVICTEGPLLVLAGAGSGKTRVLTHRISYILNSKLASEGEILAITFTNKAAREMKERLAKLLGESANDIWIGTFHAVCVRILRMDIEKLGYSRYFVIYDAQDSLQLIKECIKELNINEKMYSPKMLQAAIGKAKDQLLEVDEYKKKYSQDFKLKNVADVYELYQKKLKKNNALDFDDIILNTIKLFLDNPPVLRYYQRKFKYVLVDEYQDTNTAQYSLVSLLSQEHRNLCVVGDDDQSIYGWRGANIRNILDFEKEFKDSRVIKLEQNYRSTSKILEAANSVIVNNKGRKQKKLWTNNQEGQPVRFCEAGDEHEEAEFTAREIKKLITEQGFRYKDIAILYRMNVQSRVFEEKFIREGIPYRIYGGHKFYDRKEVKDMLAYLRLILNLSDDMALRRIVNVPGRGIGETTMDKVSAIALKTGGTLFETIERADNFQEIGRAAPKLLKFCKMIRELTSLKDKLNITSFIGEVIEKTAILSDYTEDNTDEAKSRIENIKELATVAVEFELSNSEASLEDFMAHVSLVADIDEMKEGADFVSLMTMHSAKGLEFPVVFIPGMEEGIFPGNRAMLDEKELEEERRLCYVGITRAREQLYLTGARCRTLFGSTAYNGQSRFVYEIPDDLVELVSAKRQNSFKKPTADKNKILSQKPYADMNSDGLLNKPYIDGYSDEFLNKSQIDRNSDEFLSKSQIDRTSDKFSNKLYIDRKNDETLKKPVTAVFEKKTKVVYSIDEKVTHSRFGEGTIKNIVNVKNDQMLEVDFDDADIGNKRIMASFNGLSKKH